MRITGTRISTKKPGKANPIALGLLFTIFGGVTFFLWGLPPLQYSNTSKNWPSVTGTVTQSEISTWRKDGKTHYQPKIVYTYIVDDKTYTSSKITVGDSPFDTNISPAKDIQQEYPVGKIVDVFYDPEAPASAALKPGIQNSDLAVAGITGIFLVIGILLIFSGMKTRMKNLYSSENLK